MGKPEDNIQKSLSDLTPEQLDSLGEVIEDLKDDGEINGSIRKTFPERVSIKKEKPPKRGGLIKWLIVAIIVVAIAVIVVIVFARPKTHTQISAETILQDIKGISELSGAVYSYNGVATAYTEDGNDKYYVNYYGTVEVGVNFEDVTVRVDKNEKKIIIQLPECQFLSDPVVDIGNLDYIFVKEAYNTETISAEAYRIAKDDLNQKASADEDLFNIARENIITTLEALTEPLLGQLNNEYSIVIE